jgi:predicted P-loop ATPase/GTPase
MEMKAKRSAKEAGLLQSADALKVNKIEESKDEIFIA